MKWLVLCFICLESFAQSGKSSMVEFHAGLNITSVKTATSTNGIGYGISVYRCRQTSREAFQLLAGMEFIQTAQRRIHYEITGLTQDEQITLRSISLPLFMRYQAGSNFRLCAEFGAYGSFIVSAVNRDNFSSATTVLPTKIGDLGPHIAFGVTYPDDKVVFHLRICSRYGLNDLQDHGSRGSLPHLYNRYWILCFGFGF